MNAPGKLAHRGHCFAWKPQDLAGIDPVRILDNVAIEPIDLRPEEGIPEILLRQVPEIIAPHNRVCARLGGFLGFERLRCQHTGNQRKRDASVKSAHCNRMDDAARC